MRAICSSALLLVPTVLLAAEPESTITVTASATVIAKPDSARIHYVVRMSEPSIDEAKDTIDKHLAKMKASFKDLAIPELSVSNGPTAFSRIASTGRAARGGFPPNGAAAPQPAPRNAYTAMVPLTATIRNKDADKLLKSVDAFLKKIVESGAHISGDVSDADSPFQSARASAMGSADAPRVELFQADDSATRREAYRAAMRKAKADAETLSKELGWESFRVATVLDGPSSREINEPVAPFVRTPSGEISMTARVTLKCTR